ncbi:MAG: hypothetical protein IID44_24395, partial [Planctomycetes bacterium]|nr:hypothetical protein [Planctomycetota bacterium]
MFKQTVILAAAAGLVIALIPAAQAQTINWAGGSGEWTTPGNWIGGVVPVAGQTADFGVPNPRIDVTIAGPVTVGVIENAKGTDRRWYVQSLSGVGPLTVDNNGAEATWNWGRRQGHLGFTLDVPVVLNDNLTWSGNGRGFGDSAEFLPGWSMNQPISGPGRLRLNIGDDPNDNGGSGGPWFFDMNVTNTYAGGTIVASHPGWDSENGATVRANAEQSFGTGNVTLLAGAVNDPQDTLPYNPNSTIGTNDPVGSLWITDDTADTGGDGDNRIHDTATLSLESWNDTVSTFYTWVHLDAGVDETIAELMMDGVAQASGTWGATGSGADHIDDNYFAGTGVLSVGGATIPSDLNSNGFVDFEDLTILLANWNKDVAAADGNLVEPLVSVVNFADLTVLLADWTGPGPAGAPEAALGEA